MPMRLTVALLVLGAALCLQAECAPARASAAERALVRLCPTATVNASLIEAQARRQLLHPALLVAVISHESRCSMARRGRLGEIGLGQILPTGSAARGFTRLELETEEGNLAATARHLANCLTLCGGFGGLSVYAGHKRCRSTKYSRAVLAKFWSAFGTTKMREPRSCMLIRLTTTTSSRGK